MQNLFWGILLILLGLLFLLDNMGVADFGEVIKTYWPVIIILWGIHLLLRKKGTSVITITKNETATNTDLIHRSNVFGDLSIKVTSQNFKGGSISSVFGDCHIDLLNAQIADGEHPLKLNSVFGDTIVKLPKDCTVMINASVLLGDMRILDEQTSGFSKDIQVTSPNFNVAQNKLKLNVSLVFGDIIVIQS
ncbi:MAG: cell wall-active antibiotics response protein LiaF [Bacteroidota bacterium]|nr:cell wall-active antibiotics response protein LiaF [Bacteroidota bacterium]